MPAVTLINTATSPRLCEGLCKCLMSIKPNKTKTSSQWAPERQIHTDPTRFAHLSVLYLFSSPCHLFFFHYLPLKNFKSDFSMKFQGPTETTQGALLRSHQPMRSQITWECTFWILDFFKSLFFVISHRSAHRHRATDTHSCWTKLPCAADWASLEIELWGPDTQKPHSLLHSFPSLPLFSWPFDVKGTEP